MGTKMGQMFLAAAVSLAWRISLFSTRLYVGRILLLGGCMFSATRRWRGWGCSRPSFSSTSTPISIYCSGCVRPYVGSRRRSLKRETGIGLLEKIITGLRRPHRYSPLGRERITAAFPEGRRGKVFRLSGQAPRL